mmetsp:Transcript_48538/g.89402  ORF Transcript_48538/g.89402 Transcript_48538/m.89402 type:complete len:130 (-) Transcript_48538:188-577(-)
MALVARFLVEVRTQTLSLLESLTRMVPVEYRMHPRSGVPCPSTLEDFVPYGTMRGRFRLDPAQSFQYPQHYWAPQVALPLEDDQVPGLGLQLLGPAAFHMTYPPVDHQYQAPPLREMQVCEDEGKMRVT